MGKESVVGKDRIDFHLIPDERKQKIVLQYLSDLFPLTRLVELRFVMQELFDSPLSDLPSL